MMFDALLEIVEGAERGRPCPDPALLKEAVSTIMRGEAKPTEIAALLTGLRCRGEHAEHLQAVVEVMLEHATPFEPDHNDYPLFDTCGTGGDGHGTVNISTACALLAAAAGIHVAKHGNRSVSSKSGSADVLEVLGLKIDVAPEVSARLLHECQFCFLFAPMYHPAMKHAGPVRKELRFRTIFNLAGPLSNPARPSHQLVGVPERQLIEPMARTLRLLGRHRALVVHGVNGVDEISLTQVTEGLHLREDGRLETFRLDPSDLGLQMIEMAELVAADPQDSAEKIRRVLEGEPGPIADEININLAAVLWMAGQEPDISEGFNRAREIQQSGAAARLLTEINQTIEEG